MAKKSEQLPIDMEKMMSFRETMERFKTKSEAFEYVKSTFKTKKELENACRFFKVAVRSWDKKEDLANRLVYFLVGHMLDSKVIFKGDWGSLYATSK